MSVSSCAAQSTPQEARRRNGISRHDGRSAIEGSVSEPTLHYSKCGMVAALVRVSQWDRAHRSQNDAGRPTSQSALLVDGRNRIGLPVVACRRDSGACTIAKTPSEWVAGMVPGRASDRDKEHTMKITLRRLL